MLPCLCSHRAQPSGVHGQVRPEQLQGALHEVLWWCVVRCQEQQPVHALVQGFAHETQVPGHGVEGGTLVPWVGWATTAPTTTSTSTTAATSTTVSTAAIVSTASTATTTTSTAAATAATAATATTAAHYHPPFLVRL
jgi:hypothetical protein